MAKKDEPSNNWVCLCSRNPYLCVCINSIFFLLTMRWIISIYTYVKKFAFADALFICTSTIAHDEVRTCFRNFIVVASRNFDFQLIIFLLRDLMNIFSSKPVAAARPRRWVTTWLLGIIPVKTITVVTPLDYLWTIIIDQSWLYSFSLSISLVTISSVRILDIIYIMGKEETWAVAI